MIAPRDVDVEKQAMQRRCFRQFDPALLHQLPPQGFEKGLADLDAPSRQMPAGDVAVPDQKHPVVAIEHDAADAERHAAGDPPVEVKAAPRQRFQAPSQLLQGRHANLGWTAVTFDPYIAGMIVRRLY